MTRNGFRALVVRAGAWKRRLGMIVGGVCVLAACLAARAYWTAPSASAQGPALAVPEPAESTPAARPRSEPAPAAPATQPIVPAPKPVPDIVAAVNGRPITREELGQQCLVHFGKEVIDTMINKLLILQECRQQGITIERREVDAEIERMAQRFKIPVDQWLKMLKQERGIQPEQYANDIIWPSLALRKLAGDRLIVTREELIQAFETEYGPAVRARMIICGKLDDAKRVQALAAANPAEFGNLAKQYSADAASASVKGLIPPIQKHSGCPEVENVAFALEDGAVSDVIATRGQFVILKRDGLMKARNIRVEQVASRLEDAIRERKLRTVSADVFKRLSESSRTRVENIFNDPIKSRQMPTVAAMINGQPITIRQLMDECIQRHGQDVLEGLINHKLLEQACKQQNVAVTDKDLDEEIARAASMMVKRLPDGSPDVKSWLELVAKRQNITPEVYRREVVWPSVALRKLAGAKVEVTEEDLAKGFEANYGPRVRCRAIVMNNLRRAQEVWEQARKNPTVENFGALAAKHSIEGTSRALQGEVPPIRKNAGQPVLEQEAFSLKEGELSGVIQLDSDRYVILFCEGYTKPVQVRFEEVRNDLFEDIREKKQRLEMAACFERIQDMAAIDNFLTGSSRAPVRSAAGSRGPGRVAPTTYQSVK